MSSPAQDRPPRELRPIYVARFLRHNLPMILLAGLAFATLFWLFARLTGEPVYRSACSLIITPGTEQSSFRQAPLSVTAYKQMLGSGALISQVKQRLVEEGVLQPSDPLRLGQELRSRIYLANTNKGQAAAGAPLLELISLGKTAEAAARAANLWAEVFLEQNRAMVVSSTTEAIEIFEKLYPEAKEKLQALELQELQLAAEAGASLTSLQDRASAERSRHEQETLRLYSEYNSESKRLGSELKASQLRPQQKARQKALEQAFQRLQENLAKLDDRLASAEAESLAVRRRLERTPQRHLAFSAPLPKARRVGIHPMLTARMRICSWTTAGSRRRSTPSMLSSTAGWLRPRSRWRC